MGFRGSGQAKATLGNREFEYGACEATAQTDLLKHELVASIDGETPIKTPPY